MLCKKCNNENDDKNKFCIYCGEPLKTEPKPVAPSPQPAVQTPPQPVYQHQAFQSQPKKKTGAAAAVIAVSSAVLLLVVLAVSVIYNATTINPAKYIKTNDVEFTGLNGYASVNESKLFDYKSFAEDLDIEGVDFSTGDELFDGLFGFGKDVLVASCVDVSAMEKTGNKYLSNGDTVEITVTVDRDKLESYAPKKKLRGKKEYKRTVRVSGLKEPILFDPFKAISTVSYDTTEDENTVTFEFNQDFSKELGDYKAEYFDNGFSKGIQIVDKDGNISGQIGFDASNKDYEKTKKITALTSCGQTDFDKYGIIIEKTEESFEPATVGFVTKAGEISKSDYKFIKDRAMKTIKSYYSDAKFEAAYYSTGGKSDYYNNSLTIVFSVKVAASKVYATYTIYNLKINSNGKIVNMDVNGSSGYSFDKLSSIEKELKSIWKTVSRIKE